ncbi:MAG: carbohydrate ABC transporter permease [Spirochaetota bacterium]
MSEHVKETTQIETASGEIITVNKRSVWVKIEPFVKKIPIHLIIVVFLAIWLMPTVGLFVSSFRAPEAILNTGWWTIFEPPVNLTLQNYRTVLTQSNIGQAFMNSAMIAIPATAMPILVAAFAGYALAQMRFPGRHAVFLIIVGLLIVPIQMTLIPILRLYNNLNVTGTFPALWLAHAAYGLSFAVYLMRNYIDGLPKELFDIAEIDGADNFTVFYRLVLPLTVPALASLAIFQFIWAWNDLLVALVYLGGSPDVAPLTIAISNLVGSRGRGWELLTSAAFVSVSLPLVVFFSLQRYFVRGILAGSVKG